MEKMLLDGASCERRTWIKIAQYIESDRVVKNPIAVSTKSRSIDIEVIDEQTYHKKQF